jgi:integrase
LALSAKRIARLRRRPGRHGDGHGLYLQVTAAGVASWLFRWERRGADGKRRERCMGLGPLHTVSLEEARTAARQARQQLLNGIDPLFSKHEARAAQAVAAALHCTFAQAAQSYFDQHQNTWRNPKHVKQFISTLQQYAFPMLGALPVAAIDTGLVLRVLEQKVPEGRGYPAGRFFEARPKTADRVRGRIERVLDWATVRGHRNGDNPARKLLIGKALPKTAAIAKPQHHPALPYDELPAFMAALAQRQGTAARALEFCILTAARTGEVIGATWDEIDLPNKLWTVPADRIKGGKEHKVPLSAPALALLTALPREQGNPFVFIGPRRGLSDMALFAVLQRMGRDSITVHGFRSTFRDWAAERTNYPNHVAEMALAHVVGNAVERAYRRGELLSKRERLMADWARYCMQPPVRGTVTPLRAGA